MDLAIYRAALSNVSAVRALHAENVYMTEDDLDELTRIALLISVASPIELQEMSDDDLSDFLVNLLSEADLAVLSMLDRPI